MIFNQLHNFHQADIGSRKEFIMGRRRRCCRRHHMADIQKVGSEVHCMPIEASAYHITHHQSYDRGFFSLEFLWLFFLELVLEINEKVKKKNKNTQINFESQCFDCIIPNHYKFIGAEKKRIHQQHQHREKKYKLAICISSFQSS